MRKLLFATLVFFAAGTAAIYAQTPDDNRQNAEQQQGPGNRPEGPRRHGRPGFENNERFVGIWQKVEAREVAADSVRYVYLPIWKIMNADGRFSSFILASPVEPAFQVMKGAYFAKNAHVLLERVDKSLTNPAMEGIETPIRYNFREDGKLELSFYPPGSEVPVNELWLPVKMEVPASMK